MFASAPAFTSGTSCWPDHHVNTGGAWEVVAAARTTPWKAVVLEYGWACQPTPPSRLARTLPMELIPLVHDGLSFD